MEEIKRLQDNLLLIRRAIGWSAEEFGERIGVTRQTINNLESGKSKLTKTQYIAMRSVIDVEVVKNPEEIEMVRTLLDMLVDHPEHYPTEVVQSLLDKANMITPSILSGTVSRAEVSKEWMNAAKSLGALVNQLAVGQWKKAQTVVSSWLSSLSKSSPKDSNVKEKSITQPYYELFEDDMHFGFDVELKETLATAKAAQEQFTEWQEETAVSIRQLTPDADRLDYILAACSGVLAGIADVFLVGVPNESALGELTDEWFRQRVIDFARFSGWNGREGATFEDAVRFLELKYKVPFDQTHIKQATQDVLKVTPKNHHFLNQAHNPSLFGLFFAILDQFTNSSHFVIPTELGELHRLSEAGDFTLQGSIISKVFAGFVNWVGHLISDVAGSSTSKGRGMGLPSPFLTWINDLIVIQTQLKIPVVQLEKNMQQLACKVYEHGMDVRFQTTQAIPVVINECITRFLYSTRRLYQYLLVVPSSERTVEAMWKKCSPFDNATVKRMLTVAHGTFLLVDAGDALLRSGSDPVDFIVRLNLVGIGRFSVSLYGEGNRYWKKSELHQEARMLIREEGIMANYVKGLEQLADLYDDAELLTFAEDFKIDNAYQQAFDKTVKLANKRHVPVDKILKDKEDIDRYFNGGEEK